jgi:AcrR family transcriptional regulator
MESKRLNRKQALQDHIQKDIIDSAEALFREKGYEGFTMNELAGNAGLTKRTVYRYFSSKELLFRALVLRAFRVANTMIDEGQNSSSDRGMDKIESLFRALISFSINHPHHFLAIVEYQNMETDFEDRDEITLSCYREGEHGMGVFFNAIEKGVRDGSIDPLVAGKERALAMWAMFFGLIGTCIKKEKYIRMFHNSEPEAVMNSVQPLLLKLLKKTNLNNRINKR